MPSSPVGPGGRYAPSPLIDSAAGRGLALYRLLALVYAGAIIYLNRDDVIRPLLLLVGVAVLIAWSVIAPYWRRPTRAAIVAETAIAVSGIFLTDVVYDPAAVTAGVPTVPGIWSASAVIAGALYSGVRGGVLVALVIATCNIIQTQHESAITYHNIVLMLLLGTLVGLSVNLARESQVRLETAIAAAERLAERERIGREVHDGVLQALAYINRRGREIGGGAGELADLAADQERSLRTLITRVEPGVGSVRRPGSGRFVPFGTTPPETSGEPPSGRADLAARLAAHRSASVEVVLPAGEVVLPEGYVTELDAAVAAALDNVEQHAGAGARAWVLLDVTGTEVVLTVRDDGVGMAPQRLEEAAAQGRLGVRSSIAGRLRDLGGEAVWRSRPGGGCIVTLRVARPDLAGSAA